MDANDAGRVIKVIDNRIDKKVGSLGRTDTTWAEVCEVSADGKNCSAYLYGDTDNPSQGFRVPGSLAVSVGDKVKVAWNDRGERWVFDVALASPYKKVAINPNTGEILQGNGTAPPTPLTYDPAGTADAAVTAHEAEADPHPQYYKSGEQVVVPSVEVRSDGGSPFIDFTNDAATDYDARIIYSPAIYGDEYLRFLGKAALFDSQASFPSGFLVDASGNRINSPSGHTIPTGGSTLGAIEVYNPNQTTGDAYISFHNPMRYAAHLGLDGATNDLFWGGWSRGAKYTVHHDGNAQRGWKYVEVATTALIAQGFTTAVGVTLIGTGGLVPAGAKAAQLFCYANGNSVSASNYFVARSGNDSNRVVGYAFMPPATAYYGGGQQITVPLNGSAQWYYSINYGAGTFSVFVNIIGYWLG